MTYFDKLKRRRIVQGDFLKFITFIFYIYFYV